MKAIGLFLLCVAFVVSGCGGPANVKQKAVVSAPWATEWC